MCVTEVSGKSPRHAADPGSLPERNNGAGRHSVEQPDDAVTEVIPVVVEAPVAAADEPAASASAAPAAAAPAGPPGETRLAAKRRLRRRPRVGLLVGGLFAVLAIAYGIDLFVSSGSVPRGVTVAGIDLGGKDKGEAEAILRDRLGERSEQPVAVAIGDLRSEVVPVAAGLQVDVATTMDAVGSQPLNPITRLTSFFTTRETDVTSVVDDAALTAAVTDLAASTDRKPVEGNVVFEGAEPVPVKPAVGQTLDVEGAKVALIAGWADENPVELPVEVGGVAVDATAVDRAIEEVARPAVSSEVVFTGRDNKSAVLRPELVGAVLTFVPDGRGGLAPEYNRDAATAILAPQLAVTDVKPKDAVIAVDSGFPRIVPAVVGDMVSWQKTLDQLPALLGASGARTATAIYEPVQPALTTEGATGLGIKEVIGEYSTGGFESASGVNIRKVAQVVNGAIVKPGDTFSLNGFTGPRGLEQGYVESGVIDHGRPAKAVGGGISQFATTLYNATYFAGLEDVTHTEHSYYISRYPEAREATVYEGAIDLQFRNNTSSGILIESFGNSSNVTVRIWGTKTVDVESVTGDRYAQTQPESVTLPKGDDCVASKGAPGFTTSNTRIISDRASGNEVYRHTRTVKYDPVPIVKCE
ncbi:VanW family protein [Antrihabitans sp. YC3-6]|uniref:VanW family protein n=1 Tax=Antrihabitans stalagmiti TaxID=2799499 RepID=A0A934NQ72_9NOCA|nr:VanW family protein [Antrihabitans stalagmiti]